MDAKTTSSKSDERTPIAKLQTSKSYSHLDMELGAHGMHVTKYDAEKLSSMKVFAYVKGTVLNNWMLWFDLLLVIIVSLSIAALLYPHPQITSKINENRKELTDLTKYLGGLAVFLLGFYTSVSVGRWWRLRTSGVGNIWSATSQLTLYISTFVTRDEEVISAIQRVGRGSMALVFKAQRGEMNDLNDLHERGILTEQEVRCLEGWKSNLAESIWTWAAALVHKLHSDGLIKNDQVLWTLLDRVNLGRSGAALIGAQLGTQLPMQYVHLLCLLVKTYTFVTATLAGMFIAVDLQAAADDKWVIIFYNLFSAMLLPFLYNALLVINYEIANPFGCDEMDFPDEKYDKGIQGDAKSYVDAGRNLPSWCTTGKK